MALIDCPECSKQVSDAATSCPQCGYPIHRPASAQASPSHPDVQTIEATGKGPKFAQLIGMLGFVYGLIYMFLSDTTTGGIIAIIGLSVYIIARITAWWLHG